MAQRYRPCDLRFLLENVIVDDVSDKTVSFARDNRMQLETNVYVEPDTGIVHITPCFFWEENADYSIIFSKMLRFTSGRLLLRNYAVSFKISNGVFYSRNMAGSAHNGELYLPENVLRHKDLIGAHFDETKCWVDLTFINENEDDEDAIDL